MTAVRVMSVFIWFVAAGWAWAAVKAHDPYRLAFWLGLMFWNAMDDIERNLRKPT